MNVKHETSPQETSQLIEPFRRLLMLSVFLALCIPTVLRAQSDVEACGAAYKAGTTGNVAEAIEKITTLLQGNPKSWECIAVRGALFRDKGDFKRAILDFTQAVDLAPNKELYPRQLRAGAYLRAHQWEQALADCDLVLARKKKSPGCLFFRAIALDRLGHYTEALATADEGLRLEDQSTNELRPAAYFARGDSQLHLSKYPEAIESCNQALAAGSNETWLNLVRGIAEWKLGQFEKAKADALIVVQSDPRLELRFGGDNLLELFDMDKRLLATNSAVESAQTEEAKGNWSASFEAWNTAHSYCSTFFKDGEAMENRNLAGIIRTYPKLEVKPPLSELARQYKVQAEAFFRDNSFDKAIEAYEKEMGVSPWLPHVYYNLAFLEAEHKQQFDTAIEHMQTYLKLVPNAEDARAAQDQIYVWQAKSK